jgi:hypothetical protein
MIKTFFYKMFTLSSLKILEIQFYLCDMYFGGLDFNIQAFTDTKYFQLYLDLFIFKIDFDITRRCHHHGVAFTFSVFNVNFDIRQYDIRHWDDELNDYEKDI